MGKYASRADTDSIQILVNCQAGSVWMDVPVVGSAQNCSGRWHIRSAVLPLIPAVTPQGCSSGSTHSPDLQADHRRNPQVGHTCLLNFGHTADLAQSKDRPELQTQGGCCMRGMSISEFRCITSPAKGTRECHCQTSNRQQPIVAALKRTLPPAHIASDTALVVAHSV